MADSETYHDIDEDAISELSSSPSIPEGEIDFNFVYALHTFLATVEGQATSQKGDTLILLDDSNSYWWLVKNIKDDSIGYLPAEHIETPSERLARLNKHRNVDYGASQLIDMNSAPKATLSSKFSLRKARKPVARSVTFSSPKFIEYEVFESDDEDDLAGDSETAAAIRRESLNKADQRLGDREVSATQDLDSEHGLATKSVSTKERVSSDSPHIQRTREHSTSPNDQRRSVSTPESRTHAQKESQGSFQSDAGSSVLTTEDVETKEGKKKKGVFGGLFKKRSKRDKHSPDTITKVDSRNSQNEAVSIEQKPVSVRQLVEPLDMATSEVNASAIDSMELPAAVKEMRSSVLMQTDPVTVDMVEEPHHRGPVDEVEMLHTQRVKTPIETSELEPQIAKTESFIWTDRAVEAYLRAEKDLHRQLIVVVSSQAKFERSRTAFKPANNIQAYDAINKDIDDMLKVCLTLVKFKEID